MHRTTTAVRAACAAVLLAAALLLPGCAVVAWNDLPGNNVEVIGTKNFDHHWENKKTRQQLDAIEQRLDRIDKRIEALDASG